MHVQLASLERQRRGLRRVVVDHAGAEEHDVDAIEQRRELALVGSADDEHAGSFARRKPAVVEVIAIERHQRAAELLREPVVPDVGRAPQIIVFEDEKDIPLQPRAHVDDQAGWNVGVGIDAGSRGQPLGVRREFARKGAHVALSS